MIRSFRNKGLQEFAYTGSSQKLRVQNNARIRRILAQLEAAERPEDMNLPGYRFHGLKGDRAGRYAVNASGNYRITFAWDGEDAIDVDLEDYH